MDSFQSLQPLRTLVKLVPNRRRKNECIVPRRVCLETRQAGSPHAKYFVFSREVRVLFELPV